MKKFLSLLLAACLVCSCFAGCSPFPPMTPPTTAEPVLPPEIEPTTAPIEAEPEITEPVTTEPVGETEVVEPVVGDVDWTAGFEPWQGDWISHLRNDSKDENMIVSPLSLKMACLLVAAGADGETQKQILNFFGYETLDEFMAWGENIMAVQKSLTQEDTPDIADGATDGEGEMWFSSSMPTTGVFKIANGIWHNINQPGTFTDAYRERVSRLNAQVDELAGEHLKDAINDWAEEATNGLIPEVVGDEVEDQNNILANALYLKAGWVKKFSEYLLENEDFTTSTGEIVKKTMMQQEGNFRYYADEDSEMAIFPMSSGFYMAVVKGDNSNIQTMIDSAQLELLNIKMPKFDITYKSTSIPQFMQNNGIVDAFNPAVADFSQMMDVDTFVSGITQNAKIIVDENGVEAAAVTVVQMATSSFNPDPPKPIDFFVDEAFTFYIYHEVEMEDGMFIPELLFYGEYNK